MKNYEKIEIDHIDIVTSHLCNKRCPFCIDKFIGTSSEFIKLDDITRFLKMIKEYTDKKLDVLLLGGEPTVLPKELLIEIANLIHQEGFLVMMSTNGKLKNKIVELIPYYDSIQVTVNSDEEIEFYRNWPDKINVKLAGDESLTMDKFRHFIEYTKGFSRRSISMYFTADFRELCMDEEIWELLNLIQC
jgi:MoaA/NifB/PqqE/SkfB family radical SAM enzyme